MRKILILVYSAFLIIVLANFIHYRNFYNRQIGYIVKLLDRQVQTVGIAVDSANYSFSSDLNRISFNEDLSRFFTNPETQFPSKERMKIFFSKYDKIVTGIRYYDNNRNEFTLKRDIDTEEWLEQPFVLHAQATIYNEEKILEENHQLNYYLPVLKNNETIGNLVVSIDFKKYFKSIFSEFNLRDYQWQWVINEKGETIYDNNPEQTTYSERDKIINSLASGSVANLIHKANAGGKELEVISSFYPTQLLHIELGLIFTAPTTFFRKYLIWNSLIIVFITLLLIQAIIIVFWRHIRSQKDETERLKTSEQMLFKLIEEMPAGVIVHNNKREILKANKVAAGQYSYASESEMKGKTYAESTLPGNSDYFSRNLGGSFNPDQFVIITKGSEEVVLYRNSIPVMFMGEEATMELLIDVTILESARKQAAMANEAKSEFLARMSYEIRTPLNGIIGMTDVLRKYHLTPDIREIVNLLHRSTEVLLSIINDILDFSRIESGKMIFDEVPFVLREEIDYCLDLAKTNISGDLKLSVTVDSDVPVSLIGDPFRVRQILTNLLTHSVKNTEKGEIQLKCHLKDSSDGIITLGFELLDTGRSYDSASLKKIFGSFLNIETQKVKTNDDSEFGTILSRQLVELMGGELTAESPSGLSGDHGTKITFTLKSYSNERQIKELSLEKIKTFSSVRTLVITGDQNRDEEVLSYLYRFGLSVTITTFQRSTLNQIRANQNFPEDRYSLVVLLDDEVFDGFAAAKQIWENKLTSNFIMLMISSNDKKGNYLSCITHGIDHYLIKPFDSSDLLGIIKSSFPYIKDGVSSMPEIVTVRTDISILIIEDNKMNQKVIGTLLKSLGYSFEIADDGYSGYLMAKSKSYDLIFMDLIMPEMDGFESAQRILKFDKTVIIVAFTADNMPETKRKAELSGIKEFISKPVMIDELKRLFARYFKK